METIPYGYMLEAKMGACFLSYLAIDYALDHWLNIDQRSATLKHLNEECIPMLQMFIFFAICIAPIFIALPDSFLDSWEQIVICFDLFMLFLSASILSTFPSFGVCENNLK